MKASVHSAMHQEQAMKSILFTLAVSVMFIPIHLYGDEPAGARLAPITSEVQQLIQSMGEALEAADCSRVSAFFSEGFTFYVNGHRVGSREQVLATCQEIPRPFPKAEFKVNEVQALSDDHALALRVIHMPDGAVEGKPKREVITQIWRREPDRSWRISHMHVSINEWVQ
jgi:uncharacterized protein (TIGR02246 family)